MMSFKDLVRIVVQVIVQLSNVTFKVGASLVVTLYFKSLIISFFMLIYLLFYAIGLRKLPYVREYLYLEEEKGK